ncbi:hypothetical protein NLU13_3077 [Sarocladium strictum]|uniref:MaoC-like domain-containing protein n=1 Tax=Sarocladium strictum TaxID=5046 RepID=A0AA39GP13_SARSR|nr:hypothetical protein NLU13_3077 [Sarocladium strictum]
MVLGMPATNDDYAAVSGDHNPIHLVNAMAVCGGLTRTITHGMYVSTAVRNLVQRLLDNSSGSTMRRYDVSFVGMVHAKDRLEVHVEHVAMCQGGKTLDIEVHKIDDGELVLVGKAHAKQTDSVYVFTSRGSQQTGMGMSLYESSRAAKDNWDRADKYFLETYGFVITQIVKNNPNELTVQFGGRKGKRIQKYYMDMVYRPRCPRVGGSTTKGMMFPQVDTDTTSYAFRCPTGQSEFSMCAVSPSKKAKFFTQTHLQLVVEITIYRVGFLRS